MDWLFLRAPARESSAAGPRWTCGIVLAVVSVLVLSTTAQALGAVKPPVVKTVSAFEIEKNSARLEGTVNPKGTVVSECSFEYGTSTSYGHTEPCEQDSGSGASPVIVTADATGLEANTVYHFRVVARNTAVQRNGKDKTFTPGPLPAVSKVSPKSGSTVGGNTVKIKGTALEQVTGVKFGGVDATSFHRVSAKLLTAIAPAETARSVDVTVSTAFGTSALSIGDRYTFVAPRGGGGEPEDPGDGTLTIEPTTLAPAVDDDPYSEQLSVEGGTAPYKWVAVERLPTGLELDSATGLLHGVSHRGNRGTFSLRVRVTDANGHTGNATLTLVVTQVEVTSTYMATSEGATFSKALTATGGHGPYLWGAIGGGLPTGLEVTEGGLVRGTPTESGEFQVSVLVTDGEGGGTTEGQLTIYVRPFRYRGPSVIGAAVGQPGGYYAGMSDFDEEADRCEGPPELDGMQFEPANCGYTGTPERTGEFPVVIDAYDFIGGHAQAHVTYKVVELELTTEALPGAVPGVHYEQQLEDRGGSSAPPSQPLTWSATGLPSGLHIDAASGVVSGTPAHVGINTVNVYVTDGNGAFARRQFTIPVHIPECVFEESHPCAIVNEDQSVTVAWHNPCRGCELEEGEFGYSAVEFGGGGLALGQEIYNGGNPNSVYAETLEPSHEQLMWQTFERSLLHVGPGEAFRIEVGIEYHGVERNFEPPKDLVYALGRSNYVSEP